MTHFERLNTRRARTDLIHAALTALWSTGAALGWAILLAEGARLYLGHLAQLPHP
ncbi:hypothetical protein SAMN05421774_11227 [Gemmobacter megaterium]|uniref:Uncharacterized protein n=1 Tax=Gemmobacter megaterium TaxID=1086013 RepID=A0A1N7QIK6_9RHOB|nr:hypothetical protein [Gemmobacter megaterium]GGE26797.1 hypothetical protein GCM10011345_36000 [Gemmobacter megaterium]SIT22604.1 hypothetical protein SAMN05421774_11227 [Gemmobacter megaterium]